MKHGGGSIILWRDQSWESSQGGRNQEERMMGEDFERQPKRVWVIGFSSKMTTTPKNDNDTKMPFPPGEELPAEGQSEHY